MSSKRLILLMIGLFLAFTYGIQAEVNEPSLYPEEVLPDNSQEQNNQFYVEFIRMLGLLGLVILILLLLMWFVKKMINSRLEQMNSSSLIKIVERRAITQKTTLYVLDISGKRVVMAESQNGVASLGEIPINTESSDFEKILDK
jgi:flagellar biogenesis protein FliO